MALAISTNFAINANTALNAMNKSQSLMGKSISRISTGNRAANPADDPLSYFSGNKIKGDTDGYQALYNGIQDGAARINVADTALSSIIDVLTEMKSKAIAYESLNSTDQGGDAGTAISNAYNQLYSSLSSFTGATYKGVSVWDSNGLSFTTSLGASGSPAGGSSNNVTFSAATYNVSAGTGGFTVGGASYTIDSNKVKNSSNQEVADVAVSNGTMTINNFDSDNGGTLKTALGGAESVSITLGSPTAYGSYTLDGVTFSAATYNVSAETGGFTVNGASYTIASNKVKNASDQEVAGVTVSNGTMTINNFDSTNGDTLKTALGGAESVSITLGSPTAYSSYSIAGSGSGSGSGGSGSGSGGSGNFTVSDIGQPDVSGAQTISSSGVQGVIDTISKQRTALGGSLAAMDSISSYLSSMVTANDAAYTAVTEANIAKEMTSYVKNNVYSQAAQAMISQANQSLAQVLNLLQ